MNSDTSTTMIGIVAGALTYWGRSGFAVPSSKQEWVSLAGSLAIAGLGFLTNKPGTQTDAANKETKGQ